MNWECECGVVNTGRTCPVCGASKSEGWTTEDRERHRVVRIINARDQSSYDADAYLPELSNYTKYVLSAIWNDYG